MPRKTCGAALAALVSLFSVAAALAEPTRLGSTKAGSMHWAVLTGVDDYAEVQKLKYCGADMRALRAQLVASGFSDRQVFLLHDGVAESKYRPLKANIERQLDLVLGLVEKDDLIVVAFSGHGVQVDGKSYLLPVEARLSDPKTMVSLDAIYDRLQKCPAAMKLLLVDACRNDPRPDNQKSLAPSEGMKRFAQALETPPRGILLLNSCAPGQISTEDKDLGHGVFMHYVLEGLKGQADNDRDDRVSLVELYKYANRETKVYVARKFNVHQTPTLRGEIEDDFAISRAAAREPPQPMEPLRTTVAFAVREQNENGPAVEGAAVELWHRPSGDAKPVVLGRGRSDGQGGVQFDVALNAAQRSGGEFLALATRGSSTKTWRLSQFPETRSFGLYLDAAASAATRRVLYFTRCAGFEHSAVKRSGNQLSHSETVLTKLGKDHGFDVECSKDGSVFNDIERLRKYDVIAFYTSGDLTSSFQSARQPGDSMRPEGVANLLAVIAEGKGFAGFHAATDTFHSKGSAGASQVEVTPFVAMLGGEFTTHGSQQAATVTITSPSFPGVKELDRSFKASDDSFKLMEEWYAMKNFASDLHVILVLETGNMQGSSYARPPFPIAWARMHGKGRVFYTALGHREDVWTNAHVQKMILGGLHWAAGNVPADVTPNIDQVAPKANQLRN